MRIAQLMIDMAADVARLKVDMDKAVTTVDQAMMKINGAIDSAKAGFMSFALAWAGWQGVTALAGFIKSAIDAADATGKIAERTGLATKDVAGLQLAYEMAGMGGDSLESSMAKLNKAMSEGSKTFSAMGVQIKNSDGSLRSTRDVLGDVADKFSGYQDGAAKSALAMDLFGKSGTEMISVLNLGSEGLANLDQTAASLGLTIDQQTAAAAGKFNDTLTILGAGLSGVGSKIAAQLLPTLNTMAGELLNAANNSDILDGAGKVLSVTLKALFTAGAIGTQVFLTLARNVSTAARAIAAVIKGDFAVARDIMAGGVMTNVEEWKKTGQSIGRVWDETGNKAIDFATQVEGANRKLKGMAPTLQKAAAGAKEKTKETKDELADLLNKLDAKDAGFSPTYAKDLNTLRVALQQGRIDAEQYASAMKKLLDQQPYAKQAKDFLQSLRDQVEKTRERTAMETMFGELQKKNIKWTADQLEEGIALAAKIDQMKQAEKDRADQIERGNLLYEAQSRLLSNRQQYQLDLASYGMGDKAASQMRDRVTLIQQHQAELSKLQHEQQNAIAGARDNDVEIERIRAQYATHLSIAQSTNAAELAMYDAYIEAKRQKESDWLAGAQSGLQDYLDKASDSYSQVKGLTTNAFNSMEDALVSFVQTGKLDFQSLANSIIADLIRIQIRKAAVGIFGAISGAAGGGVGGGGGDVLGAFITLNGWADGGYTGPGRVNQPAGIVHAGEGVLSQRDMAAIGGPSAFEAFRANLHRGYADGGVVSRAPSPPRPPVSAAPSAGGITVNVPVSVTTTDGGGGAGMSASAATAFAAGLKKEIEATVDTHLERAKRPGGSLWAMRNGRS